MSFYKVATRLVRVLPAEAAHKTTIKSLKLGLGPVAIGTPPKALSVKVGGLDLKSPIGLAAGFDKNAEVPDAMLAAGFGFVECGTVTPKPQIGNAKPRLFRLTQDQAVINRMGFNNEGLEAFKKRLEKRRLYRDRSPERDLDRSLGGIVGANLGANKDSPDRVADYVTGLTALWGLPDYFTVNISSPNTPGLRDLQGEKEMEELLDRISEARAILADGQASVPIFLKVAPDIALSDVDRITQQARTYGMNAIIISNTTIERPDSLKDPQKIEGGGLSGAPLFERSTEVLRAFSLASAGKIDLIGVGGISNGAQAYAKILAGAKAVQLYSALVYKGPGLVKEIERDLATRLKADGFATIADAVGKC